MQAPLNANPGAETFNIENVLYISESGLGRGSTLWLISWGGRYFIAKDTWHDPHRAYTEGEILQLLGDDIDGIPIFEEKCIVGDIASSSTLGHRAVAVGFDRAKTLLEDRQYDERVHLRLRTSLPRNADPSQPVARPIYYFTNREELIQAIIDCIIGK